MPFRILRASRRPLFRFFGSSRGGSLAVAAALLLAALVPAACVQRRDASRLAALEAGIASAQASLSALSPSTAAAPPPLPPPSGRIAGQTGTAAGAMPRPDSGSRPDAASALLDVGPDALRRWFGDPDLRRPEGDAEVLLFLGDGCALDVVLYTDAGASKRVAHAAARADGPAAVTEAECLRGLGLGGGREGVGRAVAAGHGSGR